MENTSKKLSLIESDDIENRIMFLKRRAAEADFLREERDMLISRLKLYNPDYVWPDAGINKSLNRPTDQELEDILIKNEQLTLQNEELVMQKEAMRKAYENLKMDLEMAEQELSDLEKYSEGIQSLQEENINLKKDLAQMENLKKENEQLLNDKKALQEDFSQITSNSKDSDKLLLGRWHKRAENLSQQVTNLQNELYAKDVQIDILNGKISHLIAKLNEPFIATKIKLCMGKELSAEENYIWTIHNLEITNKKVNCELQRISEQLNLLQEKYRKVQEDDKRIEKFDTGELFATLHRLTTMMREQPQKISDVSETMELLDISAGRGSTQPVSRAGSDEFIRYPLLPRSAENRLLILAAEAQIMDRIHSKLMNLKERVREVDTSRRSTRMYTLFIPPKESKIFPPFLTEF